MPGVIDPSLRGPNGELLMRVESVVPYNILNEEGEVDDSKWETFKWDLVERRTEVFEQWAPGFKDLLIDVVHVKSPKNLWDDNRTVVYGCAQGGAFNGGQSYLSRMPYRMPIDNLYMCNSVYPANLTWSGSGYISAGIIAEEMGIRDQSWWGTKPGQWFMENAERLVPTGAGWDKCAKHDYITGK
jgi:phytoene dehydrogenase-like protein